MITAVDTNVLLDFLIGNESQASKAQFLLEMRLELGALVVSPIVFAELLGVREQTAEEVLEFLQSMRIDVDLEFSMGELSKAHEAWKKYLINRKKSGSRHFCPTCQQTVDLLCPACSHEVNSPRRLLPDFLIGGHASVRADALLSRDRRVFQTYFPQLKVIAP